jgi:sugar lactone lactonase YvrE
MLFEIRCAVPAGDIRGEGAVWDSDQCALHWADINRFIMHRYLPAGKATESWLFGEPVVSVNLTTIPGQLPLVLASHVAFWSPDAHPELAVIYSLPAAPAIRFNDAKVDPRGSLWAGTMRNNVGPDGEDLDIEFAEGTLYRLDPDGSASEWMHRIGISNALAWSPDHSTYYFGDTIANAIYSFAFDRLTGTISMRRPFFTGYDKDLPDGSAMDAEGCLWVTRPFAGCLVRVRPDGSIDRTVPLPVSKPTTCAFGGPGLRTLFITSARSCRRLSGGLFAIETDVPGDPGRSTREPTSMSEAAACVSLEFARSQRSEVFDTLTSGRIEVRTSRIASFQARWLRR